MGSEQGIFMAILSIISRWLLAAVWIKAFTVRIQRKMSIFVPAFLTKALRLTWIGRL